jgi:hypothetical protein
MRQFISALSTIVFPVKDCKTADYKVRLDRRAGVISEKKSESRKGA